MCVTTAWNSSALDLHSKNTNTISVCIHDQWICRLRFWQMRRRHWKLSSNFPNSDPDLGQHCDTVLINLQDQQPNALTVTSTSSPEKSQCKWKIRLRTCEYWRSSFAGYCCSPLTFPALYHKAAGTDGVRVYQTTFFKLVTKFYKCAGLALRISLLSGKT